MTNHHARQNPLEQDTLFTTPASLMLDARLTPLERNGWVLRMLRSAEGISPLANLGHCAAISPLHRWGSGPGTDGPARSRRASADGVDQSGGAASRPSDRPCAQRVVSGSRKRPRLPASLRTRRQSARASTSLHRPRKHPGGSGGRPYQQRWRRHLKPPPLRPPINSAMTMICPDDAVAGEQTTDPLPLSGDSTSSTLVPQQTGHARHDG